MKLALRDINEQKINILFNLILKYSEISEPTWNYKLFLVKLKNIPTSKDSKMNDISALINQFLDVLEESLCLKQNSHILKDNEIIDFIIYELLQENNIKIFEVDI